MEDAGQHAGAHDQLINVRNRLFHQMFRRMALRYGSHVPYKYRRLLELNLFAKVGTGGEKQGRVECEREAREGKGFVEVGKK